MYIQRYTVASIIFIGAIGWFVFGFVSQQYIAIDVMGVHLPSLPIAAWVVIALVLFYLATLSHMMFYSMIDSLRLHKYSKDYEQMTEAISDALLDVQPRKHNFKTERYRLLGNLINNSTLSVDGKLSHIGIENIDRVIKEISQLKDGEVVDLKKYHLSDNNVFVELNNLNRYDAGVLSDENILDKPKQYGEELCIEAYSNYVSTVPVYAIDKYKSFMTKEALDVILRRINAEKNNLSITNENIIAYMNEVDLDGNDFIHLSKTLSVNMTPEQRIKLFEKLSESNEDAMNGYLYTLFDLEMLDAAKEILDNSQPSEFIRFKAYSDLKSCHKNYDIQLILS
ncbi:MAG: hypothetical protein DRG24_02030 [Epsilonproteobacteria bacterium]|nr:MAG: hypothetical protein DRG24_02030 [Campylobacterota bacterium]